MEQLADGADGVPRQREIRSLVVRPLPGARSRERSRVGRIDESALWTLRDGKVIAVCVVSTSQANALEAAGLSE